MIAATGGHMVQPLNATLFQDISCSPTKLQQIFSMKLVGDHG
jgi:hypothetical protein